MIENKEAKSLFKRFQGMPEQPKGEGAEDLIRSRIEALAKYSRSGSHAGAIVEHLITTKTFFPNEADIAQASEYILDPASEQYAANRLRCECCEGTGWIVVKKGEVEGVKRCNHAGAQ